MRAASFTGSHMRAGSYAGSHIMDPMADDMLPRLSRSPSRTRSRSRHRHYSASPSRHRSRSRAYGDYPSMGGIPPPMGYSSSYGGYPSSQSNYNAPYAPGTPWSGAPPISPSMMSNGIYPSPYSAQQMPLTYPSQPIMGSPYQAPLYGASAGGVVTIPPRQNSIGYPMSYPGASWSSTATMGVPSTQPTVIVMESKRKHRHHRH
jgi:hypothetical protein